MPDRPAVYLSRTEVAERIGVQAGALSRYKLPTPDVLIGHVNDDGSIPRGTVRGWTEKTIDEWNANRPGRGARTDLTDGAR
ncbi:helix-turn-helix domain-containing protein [Rhodococcus marinonascens]|uniref:helix-turn-helix domain-containing protein n=1 Tax=Rhodococcus marinonascens TaxID=38311 RepID=UPI000934DD8E|nr:helix-turn-helix transcriptional regulator [Rhodococcus marinonascens]